jgi:hypothetical protein
MIKKLEFKDDEISKKRFEYILHGLIILGNQNTQKGLTILNREISLLDKLEAISKPCECGKTLPGTKEPDRELDFTNTNSELVNTSLGFSIDDGEFDLLYDYIGRVPWSIGTPSRDALKTLAWLKELGHGSQAS